MENSDWNSSIRTEFDKNYINDWKFALNRCRWKLLKIVVRSLHNSVHLFISSLKSSLSWNAFSTNLCSTRWKQKKKNRIPFKQQQLVVVMPTVWRNCDGMDFGSTRNNAKLSLSFSTFSLPNKFDQKISAAYFIIFFLYPQ